MSACEYEFYLLVLIKFVSVCWHVISSLSVHHLRSLRKNYDVESKQSNFRVVTSTMLADNLVSVNAGS